MILSMTGFAAVAAELPGVSLAVELRSVNHRYLDLTLRLPDELRAVETALRETLAAALKRGKVECRIALNRTPQARQRPGGRCRPDRPAGRGGVGSDARRPGRRAAVRQRDPALARRAGRADRPPAELCRARCRAGRPGARASWPRRGRAKAPRSPPCSKPAARTSRPRSRASRRAFPRSTPRTTRSSRRACAKRALDPNEDRLKQELALFATKVDVAEELARLTTHVAEVRRVLAPGRQRRQAPRLSRAGAAPRGQHAGLEVGRRRGVAGRARAQGADRADARAGAERRVRRRASRGRARPEGRVAARPTAADARLSHAHDSPRRPRGDEPR